MILGQATVVARWMILSFHESPDKSQICYFLLCNYIDLFIPVAIPESDRLFNHAQSLSLQLAGDKGHTIWPGYWVNLYFSGVRSWISCLRCRRRRVSGILTKKIKQNMATQNQRAQSAVKLANHNARIAIQLYCYIIFWGKPVV